MLSQTQLNFNSITFAFLLVLLFALLGLWLLAEKYALIFVAFVQRTGQAMGPVTVTVTHAGAGVDSILARLFQLPYE